MELILKGGGIAGMGYVGLLTALKLLRGKRPDSVETKEDGSAVIVHNHTTIIVDRRTLELLDDIPTRAAVEKFGAAALNSPGVEAVKFEEVGDGDVTEEVRLVKADLPALVTPSPEPVPPMVERVEREVLLKIITFGLSRRI